VLLSKGQHCGERRELCRGRAGVHSLHSGMEYDSSSQSHMCFLWSLPQHTIFKKKAVFILQEEELERKRKQKAGANFYSGRGVSIYEQNSNLLSVPVYRIPNVYFIGFEKPP
jgi:hypothetical protein